MSVAVVVGNPKPGSRTLGAATALATRLTGAAPDHVVDVVTLGPSLLGWGDDTVKAAVETVAGSDLVIVASPTYKGSITGVLKCFLDQVAAGGWSGVTAVPLMLGGGPVHGLAPEYALVPVLTELGASVPTRGFYLLDSVWEDPGAYDPWLEAWGDTVRAAVSAATVPATTVPTTTVPTTTGGPR